MVPNDFDSMVSGSTDIEPVETENTGIQLANFTNRVAFDSDDIVIPRIRLAQGLTAEVQDGTAKPGQWLLTGYQPADELTVVPLMFSRQRALRDDAGAVLCKSSDSLRGLGEPGGDCAHCPMNQWADGDKGARIPPVCVFSYVYIVYVVEFQTLGLLEFRRTNITAGKTLNTIAAQRDLGNFAVKIKSSKQQGKRGTFYQTIIQPLPADQEVLNAAKAALGY